jgi:hypothetical protein
MRVSWSWTSRPRGRSLDDAPRGLEAGGLGDAKGLPGSAGQVDVVGALAAGAKVHDGSLGGGAVVVDLDLSSAPWVAGFTGHVVVGGSTLGVPEALGDGNNHHVVGEGLTASTGDARVVVDGDVDIRVASAGKASVLLGSRRRGSRSGAGSWGRGVDWLWLGSGSRSLGSRSGSLGRLWLGLLWLGLFRLGLLRLRGRSRSLRRLRLGRGRRAGLGLLNCWWSVGWGSRSAGSGSSWGAAGSGLLLLVESGRVGGGRSAGSGHGSTVVVNRGVDDNDLSDNLGLVDKSALVDGRGGGEGAEEERGEDSGGLHVDRSRDCLGCLVVEGVSWIRREWLNWLAVARECLSDRQVEDESVLREQGMWEETKASSLWNERHRRRERRGI